MFKKPFDQFSFQISDQSERCANLSGPTYSMIDSNRRSEMQYLTIVRLLMSDTLPLEYTEALTGLFHDRPSTALSFKDWLEIIFNTDNGLLERELTRREKHERLEPPTQAREKTMEETRTLLAKAIISHKCQILQVITIQPWKITWKKLTGGEHPIASPCLASKIMQAVFGVHTQHVVLTEKMLRWARAMPNCSRPRAVTQNIPAECPLAPDYYSAIEYYVRRLQLVHFHECPAVVVQGIISDT